MRQRRPKFDLTVTSPCTESWDTMSGTSTRRHCDACQKHVHNFAAMTPHQIERVIAENDGHLCARITKRADGSLVTAQELANSGFASKAAGLLLGAALTTAAAHAQSTTATRKAIVSGTFKTQDGSSLLAQGYVVFAANGQRVLETRTDQDGNWKAEIVPGTYDVIFKTSFMFGERVNRVQLHEGEQQFPTVKGHFATGRLGLVDGQVEDSQSFMGEVVITAGYRSSVSYAFKHPLRYLKDLRHNFS